MDLKQLQANTVIDQGDVGYMLTTHKPSIEGIAPIQGAPPVGYYNDPINLEKWLSRFHQYHKYTFTATSTETAVYIRSGDFYDFGTNIFDKTYNAIIPQSVTFKVLIQAPLTVNGVLAMYFDPIESYYNNRIKSMFGTQPASSPLAGWVRSLNLKAQFVKLSDSKEVTITVPLVYPVNVSLPNYNFGVIKFEHPTGLHFGTGVNSYSIVVLRRFDYPKVAPLNATL